MVTMFSEYCSPQFEVEAVEVTQVDGQKYVYPILSERVETVDPAQVNQKIGIQISEQEMVTLLGRMGLESKVNADNKIEVTIPPTRSDILHPCDIIEDVAIGYGFNNIQKTIPQTNCFSNEV
jgi:phenylalanyl-tRNA synthetase beta chain